MNGQSDEVVLSPMDIVMRTFGFPILLIFPPSATPYSLEKLESSFDHLVEQDYPILIGNFHVHPKTGSVSVKQSRASRQPGGANGIRFETNPSNAMTTEQAIQARTWDLMPTPRGKMELICVKGTLLADGGLVIGIDTSHMLFDAEAMFTLLTVWGQHYSDVKKEGRVVVNHDRHLLGGTGAPSTMSHPEYQAVEAGILGRKGQDASPPTSHHLFHFTRAMMHKIKQVATWNGLAKDGVTDPSYVSTLDAITALFIILISQARDHGKDVRVTTGVNARRRLDLPANYVGNAVFNALSTYRASELQPGDEKVAVVSPSMLGKCARRVRESILKCDETYMRDAVNFLTEQSNGSAVQVSASFYFGPDILFTSWLHLGMYKANFNGTHPWFASVPALPCYDELAMITEAQKGGDGIDMGVFLECTAMEKLKKAFVEVSYLYE